MAACCRGPRPAVAALPGDAWAVVDLIQKTDPMLATAAAIRCTVTAWQAARMSSAERAESVAEPLEMTKPPAVALTTAHVPDEDIEPS